MACNESNPLIRDGISSLNRELTALSPTHAKIDERDAADIILFAKRYAGYLNFFDSANNLDGDWTPLMDMDASVTLATLVKIDIARVSDYKRLLYKKIKSPVTTDVEAKRMFKYLFDAIFSLVTIVDDQYRRLPEEFKFIFKNVIESKLQVPLVNLEKIFNELKIATLLDYSVTELDGEATIDVNTRENFSRLSLSDEWQTAVSNLNITLPPLVNAKSSIIYVIDHNLFNAQIETLLNGIVSASTHAERLLTNTLEKFPSHTPHYALFLAFLKVFRYAQDNLNNYTKHHLDFYYKDVLQLKNKPPEPDAAHVTFELQKTAPSHILRKDTLFKAGKDIAGKEMTYKLPHNLVVNRAAVTRIQSFQKVLKNDKPGLYAYPVVNSEDGVGGKLTSPDKSWFTFGDTKKTPETNPGFAIASNILFLNEGRRTITITIDFAVDISDLKSTSFNAACFNAELTGKKDWHKIKNISIDFPAATPSQAKFTFALSPKDPPIVPYDEGIHKQKLGVKLPLLRISLEQEAVKSIPYRLLTKEIASVKVEITVEGVRDLALSSDAGSMDASKPFKPFGDFPSPGAAFYIGSKEIFQKKVYEISLNFDGATGTFTNNVQFLIDGAWKSTGATYSAKIIRPVSIDQSPVDFSKNDNLTATSLSGFVRLFTPTDYSISHYLGRINDKLKLTKINQSATTPTQYSLEIEPTPAPEEIKISNFSIDYKASQDISLVNARTETTNNLFFHFTPLGSNEVHADLLPAGITSTQRSERLTLLPFISADGELLIGLENAESDSVITILFQVAEGSSNPLKDSAEVVWFYLAGNNSWQILSSKSVVDNTKNFTTSGIVVVTLPRDASNQNTILETGLHWIKACVAGSTDAVCKMILIKAQAARVELVQDTAKEIEFRQTLPSNTISKLVIGDTVVKSIAQPFDSFGGKLRESDGHYYVRVSERLRHKQRAIAIWDYEHIVLEKFPSIFKVRCINHAGFYKENNENIFCENYPGHVTLITIPDLKNKTNTNLLRPYTPKGLLTTIEEYLKKITSPFIRIYVRSPQFEEIRLNFKVKFHDHFDPSEYRRLLNEEIERFLCPWAWDKSVEISFGGRIAKSVILNFIEEREYVDYVTCFKMDQIISRNEMTVTVVRKDIEEAVASTARSVLVSYFNDEEPDETNRRHEIDTNITCDC